MSQNVFLIDIDKCNGCCNCQIACKDEHCGTSWLPYAAEQPDTGQFWCKVDQTVHGTVPKVNITYLPRIGAQTAAIKSYAPEVLLERGDGLVVIDPQKARGRKDLAERFDGVFWNDELGIAQGCTGCAHLLDDGWTVPRCVDACATGAMRFGDADELADEIACAERLEPESYVYYKNLPKRWVAGQLVDPMADEVVIGARVTLQAEGADDFLETTTDAFGDFSFKQVGKANYRLVFEADGYVNREAFADTTDDDVNLGRIGMYKMVPLG